MNPYLGSPFGQDQQGERMVFFPCVGLDPGGVSNHRESSCFYTEKLQLHVSLKAAELLMLTSVVHATACPSEHSLPICLHLSGINCARVLCCVCCLRIGDLVLTWYASDVGKPSVALNFLITTSAPVFAPKFLGRLSIHPLQGGPALPNSWHSEWILEGKASTTVGSIYPWTTWYSSVYYSVYMEETGEKGCPWILSVLISMALMQPNVWSIYIPTV